MRNGRNSSTIRSVASVSSRRMSAVEIKCAPRMRLISGSYLSTRALSSFHPIAIEFLRFVAVLLESLVRLAAKHVQARLWAHLGHQTVKFLGLARVLAYRGR